MGHELLHRYDVTIDPYRFRQTLGRFATGVTVVTVAHGEAVRGLTVNAFTSLSLEPPLVAVCIDKAANTHRVMLESAYFGVSVLSEEQEAISRVFAGIRPPPSTVAFDALASSHVLQDALAQIACRRESVVDAGDHTLFIGAVEGLRHREGRPLIFFAGQYTTLNER